jgi:cysteine desulfurase/selenocysteine lyase
MFDVQSIRQLFPILNQVQVHKKPLVYLDNAATTQKPLPVIEAIHYYYQFQNANVHRGVHDLSQKATLLFEQTRNSIAEYFKLNDPRGIIFTKGTTESINLVAHSYPLSFLKPGDSILITGLEHHANIVPWQMACEKLGLKLLVLPITETGEWDLNLLPELLQQNVKFVSCSLVSNTLGTINPVKKMIHLAHLAGAKVLVDGAQAVGHGPIDLKEMDCDFFAFSTHKMFGPTGLGVLYGKPEILDKMIPYQTGGEMIREVTFEKTTFNDIPFKFETGTPPIAEVIAFQESLKWLSSLDWAAVHIHEQNLLNIVTSGLSKIEGIKFYGTSSQKVSVLSFLIDGIHPYDLGTILDQKGIAIRTGHHCTQPIMQFYGIPGTCRVSFSLYNTEEEANYFVQSVINALKILR